MILLHHQLNHALEMKISTANIFKCTSQVRFLKLQSIFQMQIHNLTFEI